MGAVTATCPCTCSAQSQLPGKLNIRLPGGSSITKQSGSHSSCKPSSRGRLQICAAKGQGKKRAAQQAGNQAQLPPTPPVDPDNEEFVLFIRATKFPQWYPLSVVKGGAQANVLLRAMQNDLGKLLYGKTLIRNIGSVVYSDKAKIEAMVRRSMPMLKNFSEFEYGFKVRDKSRPKDWYFPENITLIPREKELRGTVVDQVSDWWKKTTGGGK
ncbi:hypothetical protein CVIRNUC_000712 [Coccomyxa viridis]|uniref:Uncharacterized protein n=1 Tax=Coccomyxa viridis TaxID=1274662 RepID=A0AAV1HUI5_9CHLO|nr:hypothetical protein CVIRNUC_000712 [Coccomyxa viridis]